MSKILRLSIKNLWTVEQFQQLLGAAHWAYNARMGVEFLENDARYFKFPPPSYFSPFEILHDLSEGRFEKYIEPQKTLRLHRAEYASPGSIDLLGVGAIVGHVKDFVFKLMDRPDKDEKAIAREKSELENDGIMFDNAKKLIDIGESLGMTSLQKRSMIAAAYGKQRCLKRFIESGMLVDVSVHEIDHSPKEPAPDVPPPSDKPGAAGAD